MPLLLSEIDTRYRRLPGCPHGNATVNQPSELPKRMPTGDTAVINAAFRVTHNPRNNGHD